MSQNTLLLIVSIILKRKKHSYLWAVQNQVAGHCLPTHVLHDIWIHPRGYVIIRLSTFHLRKVDRKQNATGSMRER